MGRKPLAGGYVWFYGYLIDVDQTFFTALLAPTLLISVRL
jgi:hypothetical protein